MFAFLLFPPFGAAQVLDKQQQLAKQTFWDNRDWDWYAENIPFFECPDPEITTTYYYRWELLTKHLTYGSPNSGYSFTEFIDRPFWSGAYGAISCPAGHQIYESRWLRQPKFARDFLRYWFRTPGAQPRNYSCWLADSAWALNQVHRDDSFLIDLLPDLIKNYEAWEQRHFVPEVGLFWQTGHDDGMEYNINSRQTRDLVRGAPSYRPSFNAYMWADAVAIAKLARLSGQHDVAERFDAKAQSLKMTMLKILWDDKRQFFFPAYKNDEERDGHKVKALSKTYETGQFAGDPHGRELIGYVPWQFNMIDRGERYEIAWAKLMERDGFYADFGPSTVERNDPMFVLQKTCCWWSGQSWPYATTQTLKALANVLQRENSESRNEALAITKADYLKLLQIYARSHRKDGKPYLAEALHPDTGSFEGHDSYNHSEHYFHSGFCDLIITGLVGLAPRDDSHLEINPLVPENWDFFVLDDVPYRGHRVSIVWDRTGEKYQRGAGLQVLVDGRSAGSSRTLSRIVIENAVPMTDPESARKPTPESVNFAVNNDGWYFPRLTASYSAPKNPVSKLNDGNYWYLGDPPNRWTCEESPNKQDWIVVDFGVPRTIETAKLYVLDDEDAAASSVRSPQRIELDVWRDDAWQPIQAPVPSLTNPPGHRPVIVHMHATETRKLRITLHHRPGFKSGFTEIEFWGRATLPVSPVTTPAGNLAHPARTESGGLRAEFPKASASHTSRYDRVEFAIDGIVNFQPTPHNRWTSYESKSESDWLEIDFGREVTFRRIELAIYDDRGGVQAPSSYAVQYWTANQWRVVEKVTREPEQPAGGQWNEVRFDPVTASKVRLVFTHRGHSRSGVSEVFVWND